jgi:hypothetical protein
MPLYLPLSQPKDLTPWYRSQQNMKLEKRQTNIFQDWVGLQLKTLNILQTTWV